ncbi:C45 family autoproteolytic acyltransferase/hydolase [Aestuariivivens sediminicola]|uniref:C45 family autoproteolytic acyltransferase/hydolase n=1 Tax=Aestuariivivens sediminicola TaxID=2913560 RepID=UPI001F5AB9B5|nr:C45 family peptidase [Aestuariivivens sediminicola]
MKLLIKLLLGILVVTSCSQDPKTRELKVVSFDGSGYELGLKHGTELKQEIGQVILAWKKNVKNQLNKDPNVVLNGFFEYANFDESIKKWTPDLYEEIRGIAKGSQQNFNDILVLNLLDEFWVYVDNENNHHCSGIGVPSRDGSPGYLSQNMDLENYTDGFQVLMRLNRTDDRPEQLILTHPGLIALNGLNEKGVGVCVNTIMQLKASSSGLPVAFVVRRIINSDNKEDLLNFIQNVNHASGQNYILGVKGEVFDFEASANKVVQYNPSNENGTVYHTNHPLVNDDVKPWYKKYNPNLPKDSQLSKFNSLYRFEAVEKRIANSTELSESALIETLRSKDDKNNPVCRTYRKKGYGFTFASIVMEMSERPYIKLTVGPPDESDFQRFDFSVDE